MSQPVRFALVPVVVIALIAAIAAIGAWPRAAQAEGEVMVRAGDGEPGYAVNLYLPNDITVMEGDTVTWDFPWLEPHTVTFGTPAGDPTQPSNPDDAVVAFDGETYFSSGLIAQTTFSVQFNAAGAYTIFCVIHPLMTGTVTVVESGDVDTQDDLDARADDAYATSLAALKEVAAGLAGAPTAVEERADGTKKYTVVVGGIIPNGSDVMQFFAPSLSLNEGDTVVFLNDTPTPHTATFRMDQYPGGDPFEVPASAQDQPYDGSTFWNSGILGVDWPGGLSWEVTFSKAGAYDYVCVLHAEQGMVGTVNVATAPAPAPTPTPEAPATGSGIAPSGPGYSLVLALAAALFVFAGATTIIVAQRSR